MSDKHGHHVSERSFPKNILWEDIELALENSIQENGGFTTAHKALVTLPDGKEIFVKTATDDETRINAEKEIRVYHHLQRQQYQYAPQLIAVRSDMAAFALEALTSNNGWDWSCAWSEPRLAKALEAMDALTSIKLTDNDKQLLRARTLREDGGGWRLLNESFEARIAVQQGLIANGHSAVAEKLDFKKMAKFEDGFRLRSDSVVHYDVRSYNCAYQADSETVKVIDYDCLNAEGDARLADAFTLADAQSSGVDVAQNHAARLDADVLRWAAGYWLRASLNPNIDPYDKGLKFGRVAAALALSAWVGEN